MPQLNNCWNLLPNFFEHQYFRNTLGVWHLDKPDFPNNSKCAWQSKCQKLWRKSMIRILKLCLSWNILETVGNCILKRATNANRITVDSCWQYGEKCWIYWPLAAAILTIVRVECRNYWCHNIVVLSSWLSYYCQCRIVSLPLIQQTIQNFQIMNSKPRI